MGRSRLSGRYGVFPYHCETALWHETNGVINYIGEWHTHPNMQAVPSSTDISSLKEITEKVKGVLPGTILIIAGKENQTNLILQKDNAIWIQSLLKEKEEGE